MLNKTLKALLTAIVLLLISVGFGLCVRDIDKSDNSSIEYLQKMKRPIIVIAKSNDGAILKDADGNMFQALPSYCSGSAIIASYNLGDTLK